MSFLCWHKSHFAVHTEVVFKLYTGSYFSSGNYTGLLTVSKLGLFDSLFGIVSQISIYFTSESMRNVTVLVEILTISIYFQEICSNL